MKARVLAFLVLCVCQISGFSQDGCSEEYFKILGSVFEDELGYSLAASLDEQFVYVGGSKNGEAIILKMSAQGVIEWTRTFDVVPNEPDIIFRILVDSEGMIGVSGIAGSQNGGGTVFVFRYNPFTNTVLWAEELISTSVNYNLGMIELGPGGNYLVTNNPSAPNVAELVMLNRVTGAVIPAFSKHYDLGSSETMYDMVLDGGSLYAAGRFTDGGGPAQMRNTLIKMDPSNGNVDWMKLGHKPAAQAQRLYGVDLVIAQNDIFSICMGDETGTNLNSGTEVFVQRTGLDGSLIWLKQYQLPGNNNWVDEIIESQGGLVILARNRVAPSDLFLFKIDYDGNVQWAKQFDYAVNDNAAFLGSIQSQLIEADNHLYFTAFAEESSNNDLILAKTDLDGEIGGECMESTDISIPVLDVNNPVFYNQTPMVTDYEPQLIIHSVTEGIEVSLESHTICSVPIFFETQLDAEICEGEVFEGYSMTGVYVDTFTSMDGCDSIRTLALNVVNTSTTNISAEICPQGVYEGYSQEGVYQDTFQNINGCDSIRVLSLTVLNNDLTNIEIALCDGQSYEGYSAEGMYQDVFQNINGCDSIRNLSITTILPTTTYVNGQLCDGALYGYFTEGIYQDTFMTITGCDSIRTLNLLGIDIYIPNVFSPNNDGVNDLFKISYFPNESIENVTFTIFDRFGDMVYSTESWPVAWDGKSKDGRFYNPGVFTYVFHYVCNGSTVLEKGDITLLR